MTLLASKKISREDSSLSGKNFRILPLRAEDVSDRYIAWLNDPKVNQFLEVRFAAQTRESVISYVELHEKAEDRYLWGIYPLNESFYVGTATLTQINRQHGSGEIGLLVGELDYWGKNASAEAMELVMKFGFEQLKLRRLTGGSYSLNMGMNFTFKRLGFRCEAKMLKAYQHTPGNYVDGYRWAILKEEWDKKS